MKRGPTIFLQIVIVFFGMLVLFLLLLEPQTEGRNVNATQVEIYFKDPFLVFIYLAFVPFFVGLYQVIKLLGYARREEMFSERAVRSMRMIKFCAIATALFFLGAEAYIFVFVRGTDDVAGGVMMGAFFILVSAVVATAAAVFERILRDGRDLKTENDLTV